MAQKGWLVRKAAQFLEPGERFIYAPNIGGEGHIVKVVSVESYYGVTMIETEEDECCRIAVLSSHWVEMA
jgi:hypothetical protein